MSKQKITKEQIIRRVANIEYKDMGTIRSIYNSIEKTIRDYIISTKPDNPMSIKLCDGISIDSTYVPEKLKKNNLTGEIMRVSARIKPKFNITRNYLENINSSHK